MPPPPPSTGDKGVDAALRAQAAARANAEQQQEFLRDLVAWEKKARVKDEGLKQTKSIVSSLPPVRNSGAAPAPAKGAGATTGGGGRAGKGSREDKPQPIPGGDFRAWDKFDVDKALEEVDAEDGDGAGEAVGPDDEAEALRERLLREHRGNEEKKMGNAQFKQGKYAAAIACYTRGIEHDPNSAALVANRAMAHLNMKRYAEAERDCTAAIEIAPTYIKAWQRRATARAALQRLEEALNDYKMVLKLDPKDKVARREAGALPKRIADAKEKARLAFRPLEHAGDVTTLSTARSSQTLHRIAIEEIGGSNDDGDGANDDGGGAASSSSPGTAASATSGGGATTTSSSTAAAAAVEEAPASPRENGAARHPASASGSGAACGGKPRKVQIQEVDGSDSDSDDGDVPAAGVQTAAAAGPASSPSGGVVAPECRLATAAPSQAPASSSPGKPASGKPPRQSPSAAGNATAAAAAAAAGSKMTPARFEASWRRLDAAGMLALLQSVRPAQLPGLIKNNLCAELLTAVLGALAQQPGAGTIDELAVLEHLAKTRRFDQTLMFLDDAELKPLKAVLTALRQSGGADGERIDRVGSLYRV